MLIESDLPGTKAIDRTSMNAFEDDAFREAVLKTGRRLLIFGGVRFAPHTGMPHL